MMRTFRLTGIAAGCALALSLAPALAQTAAPASPPAAQEPGASQMPDMDAMREMMRETMREMMGPGAMRGDRQRPGMMRQRDRSDRPYHRMGRRGDMDRSGWRGDRQGMNRGGMHRAGMRILFAVVDEDGDGALSLAEIQEFHARVFASVDDNGDGRVDMDEIGAFFHGFAGPDSDDDNDDDDTDN